MKCNEEAAKTLGRGKVRFLLNGVGSVYHVFLMQFWFWLCLLSPTFTIPTELPTVLVTGSTDGIGKHTSLRLLQHGYRVFIHGRDQQKLDATVAELSQHGDVNGFCHDLSSVQGCTDLASDVKKNTPKLDVLINNAGCVFNLPNLHPH